MESHTLVLATTKTTIPPDLFIEFVTSLINRSVAMVEYFGPEIDNPCDFIDDDMKNVSEEITYIEIFFDTELPIDYDDLDESQVDELILSTIGASSKIEMKSDGKDIVVHLHH